MKHPLPEHTSDQQLAEDFKTYFTNKTLHTHNNLNDIKSKFDITETEDIREYQTKLDCFEQVSGKLCVIHHKFSEKELLFRSDSNMVVGEV